MFRDKRLLTAEEYLAHAYAIPALIPFMPMPDEKFVGSWREAAGREVLDFLTAELGLPALAFDWEHESALAISFVQTLGGKLPVIDTASHRDFRQMEALLNGRKEVRNLLASVNAFTLQTKASSLYRHRVLLLNRAPYSNVSAAAAGCPEEEWLERSHHLRLAHECAHYETLRILGCMKNHALDELLADTLGQLAAFGNFSAARQRAFFGLTKGEDSCTGRLAFYTNNVLPEERGRVFRAVDQVLDILEVEVKALLSQKAGKLEWLTGIAGKSITERLADAGCLSDKFPRKMT